MASKKTAIVSVTNDLFTDNRVDKICLFLVKQGYQVTLVGRLKKDSQALQPRIYQTKRFRLIKETGAGFYAAYNLRLFFYLLFHKTDLLVSNDLDTLLANYLASKFKSATRLVYDSHEYFTEVPELINRPKIQKIWERIEGWIFPKLETVYTVNSSIAQLYKNKYKKEISVVRNISPKWKALNVPSKKDLGIPENTFLIIIQGAGINVDRGAEEAVEAMKFIENAVLLIVGDGDVLAELKKNVIKYDLQKKVLFYGKRPYAELMAFTHYADVGLTLDKPSNLNYLYSLPNKVFDYIHTSTPIVCTKLIEIEQLVTKYEIGTVLEELSIRNLVAAVTNLQENQEILAKMKHNCENAANNESWEHETTILEKIYPKVD